VTYAYRLVVVRQSSKSGPGHDCRF